MSSFKMNGYTWLIKFVDQNSEFLDDRTGNHTVGTTDPRTYTIYLSNTLSGEFLTRVLIHELAHATMFSYDLHRNIRRLVYPEHYILAEEEVCNFIADYGWQMFKIAYRYLGDHALSFVPAELERLVA